MDYKLLLETVRYLKPTQVAYQVLAKVYHPTLKNVTAPVVNQVPKIVLPIAKYECCKGNEFTFLNIKDSFHSWTQTNHGMLWAYNLNYMDWLNQGQTTGGKCLMVDDSVCSCWIDKFIAGFPQNYVGQDPYPTALRVINWIKAFCREPHLRTQEREDSLYSQVLLLKKKLEYRLLGNHLLEDAYALFIAAIYFGVEDLYENASTLLKKQLKEQVLADGAHYEQSPMYHCILLDRLLDCVNFSMTTDDKDCSDYLKGVAVQMLGHLESIKWEDGSIPLLNDAANGIAPTPTQLFDYARRLGLVWTAIEMKECGYRRLRSRRFDAIIDIGNIAATYQPGHSHADTFNYELRIDGKPVVVDTGISTYDKTTRRQYERGTSAHNTVVVDGKDSSRVWGGFRVGRRAEVTDVRCRMEEGKSEIEASHDGYRRNGKHTRKFTMDEWGLHIEDTIGPGRKGVNYIHLAPGMEANEVENEPNQIFICNQKAEHMIEFSGCNKVEILKEKVSTEYNQFKDIFVLALHFEGKMSYTIIDEKG